MRRGARGSGFLCCRVSISLGTPGEAACRINMPTSSPAPFPKLFPVTQTQLHGQAHGVPNPAPSWATELLGHGRVSRGVTGRCQQDTHSARLSRGNPIKSVAVAFLLTPASASNRNQVPPLCPYQAWHLLGNISRESSPSGSGPPQYPSVGSMILPTARGPINPSHILAPSLVHGVQHWEHPPQSLTSATLHPRGVAVIHSQFPEIPSLAFSLLPPHSPVQGHPTS